MHSTRHRLLLASTIVAAAALGACKGGEKQPAVESTAAATTDTSAGGGAAVAAPSGGTVTPGPGGKVIVVELITDATGNYFKPKELEAKPNDVIRYTLTAGVHNVDFLPDSNPGKTGLPKASEMLQLPGQTFDVAVKSFAPGHYYFQCDPHAALGMRGHLEVEKD